MLIPLAHIRPVSLNAFLIRVSVQKPLIHYNCTCLHHLLRQLTPDTRQPLCGKIYPSKISFQFLPFCHLSSHSSALGKRFIYLSYLNHSIYTVNLCKLSPQLVGSIVNKPSLINLSLKLLPSIPGNILIGRFKWLTQCIPMFFLSLLFMKVTNEVFCLRNPMEQIHFKVDWELLFSLLKWYSAKRGS